MSLLCSTVLTSTVGFNWLLTKITSKIIPFTLFERFFFENFSMTNRFDDVTIHLKQSDPDSVRVIVTADHSRGAANKQKNMVPFFFFRRLIY